MRILIVDDDPIAARLLAKYLNRVGESDIAPNGREAVRLFKRSFTENYPFDLICLDILMPKMNGHDTLREIREIEHHESVRIGEGVKVIMVSAMHDDNTILQAFMELCDGFVAKPVDRKALFAKLEEIELLSDYSKA